MLSSYVCGGVGSGDGAPVTKNLHCPTSVPALAGSPAANRAMLAASLEVTVPLAFTSEVNRWFWLTNGTAPEAPCATRAASLEVIDPFGPPGLVGLTVYAPAPNPVSVYCPLVAVMTGPTAGAPAVLLSDTFFTNRGGVAGACTFPYVIVPLSDSPPPPAGGVAVGVLVAVAVAVDVAVGVGPPAHGNPKIVSMRTPVAPLAIRL